MNDNEKNPLLAGAPLPLFTSISPEHIEIAVDTVLADARAQITQLTAALDTPSWQSLVMPMEAIDARIQAVWSPVSHMNSVVNTEALRQAYHACLPKLSKFSTELGQNTALYRAYQQLAESDEYQHLDSAQQRVIDNALRDFRLSGVNLTAAERTTFQQLSQSLTAMTAKFEENVLDATQAWQLHITDEAELAGLPESTKSMMAQIAARDNKAGWLITLDYPVYLPVMTYASNRALRQKVYTAFVTRASEQGPHAGQWDNSGVMTKILSLRHQLAQLLGFENYAERSLVTKMASSPHQVLQFLTELAEKSQPIAQQELAELTAFAQKTTQIESLAAWDVMYFSEQLRQEKYAISQEEVKPYFPEETVLSGLFEVVKRLYGLKISEKQQQEVWHPAVRFFEIFDKKGQLRGQFYLDLYARQHKRGGAWMDECKVKRQTESGVETPVAYLTCNFSEPVGDKPALLTHDEVTTLFHEFGHGLHHMLTQIPYADVSGINGVPWDAVELPSQFMENWCWEKEALALISGHYQTGEPLPKALFDKMHAARNFQSAMMMLRQVEFSLFDFRLHLEYAPEGQQQVAMILQQVRQAVAVYQPPSFNRFAHTFSHIFAGGYAAGYYSYKWAEVLSADAFSRFEEEGIFNTVTGQAFLTEILEKGGSADPMTLFKAFRGREPKIDALLRHSGIAA